jgi:hypothetical protein
MSSKSGTVGHFAMGMDIVYMLTEVLHIILTFSINVQRVIRYSRKNYEKPPLRT